MASLTEDIASIEHKVEILINLHRKLLAENAKVVSQFDALKQQSEAMQSELAVYREKDKISQLAKEIDIDGAVQTHEVKQKLNNMVKEIDRCISLLRS